MTALERTIETIQKAFDLLDHVEQLREPAVHFEYSIMYNAASNRDKWNLVTIAADRLLRYLYVETKRQIVEGRKVYPKWTSWHLLENLYEVSQWWSQGLSDKVAVQCAIYQRADDALVTAYHAGLFEESSPAFKIAFERVARRDRSLKAGRSGWRKKDQRTTASSKNRVSKKGFDPTREDIFARTLANRTF